MERYYRTSFHHTGAGCLDEAGTIVQQRSEFDFLSVFSFWTSSFHGAWQGRPISHGIFTHLGDQMVAAEAANDHFAGKASKTR
jgi:hypothetical protein